VDARGDIREFLTSRRARVTPAQVGLPAYGDHRRVPGLRREEVALLAGVSVDYYYSLHVAPGRPANTARFTFLDPRAEDFYLDWDRVADEVVAIVRSEAGRDPYDRGLTELVGELSTQSETFRTKWAAHNVRFHDTGLKRLHHPIVGDLELTYETMELSADHGLTMFAYTAEPGSSSAQNLDLLASWAATTADVAG
jgi:hypothetical protein